MKVNRFVPGRRILVCDYDSKMNSTDILPIEETKLASIRVTRACADKINELNQWQEQSIAESSTHPFPPVKKK